KIMSAATGHLEVARAARPWQIQEKDMGEPPMPQRPAWWIIFRELGIALFILVAALLAYLKQPNFLSASSARSIALAIPLWVVVAMGQMIVIISRNIDLLVGSIMGLAAMVACGSFIGHAVWP